jgi:hypothetical protein
VAERSLVRAVSCQSTPRRDKPDGGEWQYSFTNENTAKAGSLETNYGGVSIQKKRKRIDLD